MYVCIYRHDYLLHLKIIKNKEEQDPTLLIQPCHIINENQFAFLN